MRAKPVAWRNEAAAIGAKAAKFQKRRAALAKRMAAGKSNLRTEERKFGAAVVKLLKTDAELRAVLLPKLQAALTNPRDKAMLETIAGAGADMYNAPIQSPERK
jgi:hypothetical protein